MATLIDDGWVYLTDGSDVIKARARDILYAEAWDPDIEHYTGNAQFGFWLNRAVRTWKVKGLLFDTHAKYTSFVSNLRSWNNSAPFTLGIYRDSSSNYWECDGTNTTFTVLAYGIGGGRKIAPEDGTVYEIGLVTFEEAG